MKTQVVLMKELNPAPGLVWCRVKIVDCRCISLIRDKTRSAVADKLLRILRVGSRRKQFVVMMKNKKSIVVQYLAQLCCIYF